MSTYTECGEAARRLLNDPSLRIVTHVPEGLFTDVDVILLAAREAALKDRPYTEAVMKVAQREASQVMGGLFRTNQAVRYGPVMLPGFKNPDYLRIESRIAYGSPDGPATIATPNGAFPIMFTEHDLDKRSGRRLGVARTDLEPWDDQDLGAPASQNGEHERQVLGLRAELAGVQAQLAESEEENQVLRDRLASTVTRAEVEQLVAERLGRAG